MNTEQLLRNLGATGNLKGFRYAVHMIELAEPDRSYKGHKVPLPGNSQTFQCFPKCCGAQSAYCYPYLLEPWEPGVF